MPHIIIIKYKDILYYTKIVSFVFNILNNLLTEIYYIYSSLVIIYDTKVPIRKLTLLILKL